jgi:hypothetical protein
MSPWQKRRRKREDGEVLGVTRCERDVLEALARLIWSTGGRGNDGRGREATSGHGGRQVD